MVVLNKFLFLLIEVLIVLFIIKLNLFIVFESIDKFLISFVFVIVGNGVVEMFFIVGVDVVIVLRVVLRIVLMVFDIEIWILLDGVDVKILVFDNGGV